MRRAFALLAVALTLAFAPPAGAARRVAVVVGANDGLPDEVSLRYAEADAERIARILRDLGGFGAADVLLLTGVDAEEVRRALIGVNARLRAEAGDALLFVYYSGHGDAESLHLSRTRFDLAELRELLAGSPARTRVLVVDSCRSGAFTRVKGGSPGPAFAIGFEPGNVEGVAILTSSAAGEDSQEADGLGASIFTHFLASALQGAADRDADGRVTLAEAYAYASDRTLAASAATFAGPQHPTYRFDLGGRGDLVLTRPGSSAKVGLLAFPAGGTYVVHQGAPEGPVVAEVSGERPAQLALRPGVYHVTRRGRDHLLLGEVRVTEAATRSLQLAAMRRVDFARVVRKGGTERATAVQAFAAGAVRGPILDLGLATGAIVGARLDLPFLGLEARVGILQSSVAPDRLAIDTRELTAALAAFRAFDLGPVTVAGGVEGGGVWLDQRFHERQTPDRRSYGLSLGPTAAVETALAGPWTLRLDGAFLTYLLPDVADQTRTAVTWRAGAGVGRFF